LNEDDRTKVSKVPSKEHERFEALQALYDNKQQWVRHYETLLAQLTPISTTASLAISAYIAENSDNIVYAKWTLTIPLVISLFALWFNWWCDAEIKRQFDQIVSAEIGMGFYEILVEDKHVLPPEYKDSPIRTRPIVWAGYVSQSISLIAITIVALVI
jgi:hypothetical protein